MMRGAVRVEAEGDAVRTCEGQPRRWTDAAAVASERRRLWPPS